MIYFIDVAGEHLMTNVRQFVTVTELTPRIMHFELLVAQDDAREAILTCVRLALEDCYVFPISDRTLVQFKAIPESVRKILQHNLDLRDAKQRSAP